MIYDIHGNEAISKYEWKGNYVIASDMIKRKVYVKKLGEIIYSQAFCKYGDYFYAIDEQNRIAKYDEDFNLITTQSITTGHGNALQLGNGSIAYSSGWDDNKIYPIDLNTLTNGTAITLPTTGYTTCAVDEYRKLIYIFQRDTYPTTKEHYNFIVYDYDNQSIISTKKTAASFAGIQACDLFNDHIIVLNGLENATQYDAPNGYRIYDLGGNIVAEFFMPEFSGREPEGVCVDRDTRRLYFGIGHDVYEIMADDF